jgi:hypothetical protein
LPASANDPFAAMVLGLEQYGLGLRIRLGIICLAS